MVHKTSMKNVDIEVKDEGGVGENRAFSNRFFSQFVDSELQDIEKYFSEEDLLDIANNFGGYVDTLENYDTHNRSDLTINRQAIQENSREEDDSNSLITDSSINITQV